MKEISEYLKLIKKDSNLFFGIIIFSMLIVFAYFNNKKEFYQTSFAINVIRTGLMKNDCHHCNEYYSSNADDKFSETLVEWLKLPSISREIDAKNIRQSNRKENFFIRNLKSEKKSSQLILITFESSSPDMAKEASFSVKRTLDDNIDKINQYQFNENPFKLIAFDPVSTKYRPNFSRIIMGSLLGGTFIAFFSVLAKNYFKKKKI